MITVTIPARFYDDHVWRACLPGIEVKRTSRRVTVMLDAAAWDDLLSDAEHYSEAWQFEREYFGLCRSAAATHKAMMAAAEVSQVSFD